MILCNDIIFINKFVDKYISTCRCSCMFFSADERFTDCNLYYQLILNIRHSRGDKLAKNCPCQWSLVSKAMLWHYLSQPAEVYNHNGQDLVMKAVSTILLCAFDTDSCCVYHLLSPTLCIT